MHITNAVLNIEACSYFPANRVIELLKIGIYFQMTFKRPATNRQLTFQEIADTARLPVNEVSGCLVYNLFINGIKHFRNNHTSTKMHICAL